MSHRAFIAAILTSATLTASVAVAADAPDASPAKLTSLIGLELDNPFNIDLKIIRGPNAEKNKIDAENLNRSLTRRLSEAGFRLGAEPTAGSLEIRIDTDSAGEFLSLILRFRRRVEFTAHKKTFTAPADVWTRSFAGSINSQHAVIPLISEQYIDQFIEDHKRSNARLELAGSIAAADPKYVFVVLDIGSNHGVEEKMEFEVRRNGKPVGAIKVVSVKATHAVANPIEGTDGLELIEGDTVVAR